MNDILVTVVGNVVTDVTLRYTAKGDPVANFRMASNPRRYDSETHEWIDGESVYLSVACYRSLAANVAESLRKGLPVIVTGRLRVRRVDKQVGEETVAQQFVDIDATTVGPNLQWTTADVTRAKTVEVEGLERRAIAEALAAVDSGLAAA